MHHRCRPVSASPLAAQCAHRRYSFLDNRDDRDCQCPIRLSESPGAAHRSLWRRWHRRRRDAHCGGPADWPAQTTVRRRESSRSRRNRRRESRRVGCSRRLYRADDRQQQRHQRVPFQIAAYNILADFASTSTTSFFDLLIVTRAGSPLKSVEDIAKMARANPGTLNIATINPGSTQNLAAELFSSVADIKVTIVPFRTSPDIATALLRGDVDIAFEFYAAIRGQIADKKVVAVASTGPKRTAYLPAVPTVQESGIKDFEVVSWNGISVPAAT